MPAQPWLQLGGRAPAVAFGASTPDAVVRTVLGARIFLGGVARRLAGSRAGAGGGIKPGQLTTLIKGCSNPAGLKRLLEDHGQSFNFMHVGAAWSSLAKMLKGGGARGYAEPADNEVIQLLQDPTRAAVNEMGARGVANVLHSMGQLHQSGGMVSGDELMGELLARALALAGDFIFIPMGIAHVMWALATMGITPDPRLLEAMQRQALARAADFEPRHASTVLEALATMRIEPEPRLLEAMLTSAGDADVSSSRRATSTAGGFNPQGVANSPRSTPDGEGRDLDCDPRTDGGGRDLDGVGRDHRSAQPASIARPAPAAWMYNRAQRDKMRSLWQDGLLDTEAGPREWAPSISGMVNERGEVGRLVDLADLKRWLEREKAKPLE